MWQAAVGCPGQRHLDQSPTQPSDIDLVMDLEDAACRAPFLIRDRDGKFPALFDDILADAEIKVVLSGVRMPRMKLGHGAVGADLSA